MAKNTMNMAKGIGIGVLTGATAIAVSSAVMHQRNKQKPMNQIKQTAGKAVHTVNEILGSMESMLK